MSKAIALLVAFFVVCALPPTAYATPSDDESAAIDHLITFVRESKLQFIRNGDAHDSAEAADHIAMKYAQVKNRLSTADEFIDDVASKSSLSGKPYLIRQADGTEQPVADWLHEELKKYRDTQKKP